jgi:hypothetical protein
MIMSLSDTSQPLLPCGLTPWDLVQGASPRQVVRVAQRDNDGEVLNLYSGLSPVDGPAPAEPWALLLANDEKNFELLAFDFDSAKGDPAADSRTLATALAKAGIGNCVTQSGPSKGRHVWIGMAEPLSADSTKALAQLVKLLCPSLDLSPLSNPRSGCVRPPGSPHRAGGASRVIGGNEVELIMRKTTHAQIVALEQILTEQIPVDVLHPDPQHLPPRMTNSGDAVLGQKAIREASDGHPWLPGTKAGLSTSAAQALKTPAKKIKDASSVLWTVLLGAARAHWTLTQAREALSHSAAMTHVVSAAHGSSRRRRNRWEQKRILERQWAKAVSAAASRVEGSDPTFVDRGNTVAAVIDEVQARADASPARWQTPGGHADRLVLDAMCVIALEAVATRIEIDVRRLSEMIGAITAQTVATARKRLASDGWVTLDELSQGTHAAAYIVGPPESRIDPHRGTSTQPQLTFPQPPSGPLHKPSHAPRPQLLQTLTTRLEATSHDSFTSTSLPAGSARLYQALHSHSQSERELLPQFGADLPDLLRRLLEAGLALVTNDGVRRGKAPLQRVAENIGATGRLHARRLLHKAERILWHWWLAEVNDEPEAQLVPFPRMASGAADYKAARMVVERDGKPWEKAEVVA